MTSPVFVVCCFSTSHICVHDELKEEPDPSTDWTVSLSVVWQTSLLPCHRTYKVVGRVKVSTLCARADSEVHFWLLLMWNQPATQPPQPRVHWIWRQQNFQESLQFIEWSAYTCEGLAVCITSWLLTLAVWYWEVRLPCFWKPCQL